MGRAAHVESLWNGIVDASGEPLAAGKVYSYAAGTTTPKALYQDPACDTAHANPLVLDSAGKALAYADGTYKFVIKTSTDVTLETRDNLLYQAAGDIIRFGGVSTGGPTSYGVTISPDLAAYYDGLRVAFVPNTTSTGAATININGIGAISLYHLDGGASVGGELVSGRVAEVIYYGGYFCLLAGEDPRPWNAWSPSYAATGSMTYTSVTTSVARWKQKGKLIYCRLVAYGTTGGTASYGLTATLPVTAYDGNHQGGSNIQDGGNWLVGGYTAGPSTMVITKADYSNWGLGASRYIAANFVYEAA